MRDLSKIPEGLPVPINDGGCDHLKSISLPAISLRSTSDRLIDLGRLQQQTVIFSIQGLGSPKNPLQQIGI